MSRLEVVADGRRYLFEEGAEILLGRANHAQILLSDGRIGRAHARLSWTDGAWWLEDQDSTNGTFIDGLRVQRRRVDGELTARLANPTNGMLLYVRLVSSQPPAAVPQPRPAGAPAPAPPPAAPVAPAPAPPPAAPVAPAPGPAPAPVMPSAPVSPRLGPSTSASLVAPVLIVRLGERTLVFPPGMPVRIGRDPGLEAHTNHPLVSSNYHGLITSSHDGAMYTDSSSRGTYKDGKPIKTLHITSPVTLRLGDPATGEELGITPPLPLDRLLANQRRQARSKRLKLVGAGIAALLLIAGAAVGVVLSTASKGSPQPTPTSTGLSQATLTHAERATVRLLEGTEDDYTGWGSGSIVAPTGLILTNAHVAAPSTPGMAVATATPGAALDDNPDFVTVEVTTSDSSAVVPKYRAKVVAVDGFLDLAVVQIYATNTGAALDPASLNLPYLPLGDVSTLHLDQNLTVLGFPGVSDSDSITVTNGVLSTFVPDATGHVNDARFELETTARVAHGNSGGAAITDTGELVGVPSLSIPGEGSDLSWRLRSVTEAAPLIAAAKAGRAYTSDILTPLTGGEQVTEAGIGSTQQDACGGNVTDSHGGTTAIVGVTLTGAQPGLDVALLIELPDQQYVESQGGPGQPVPGVPETTVSTPRQCLAYPVSASSLGLSEVPSGTYLVQLLGGPNLDPIGPTTQLAVGTA